MTLQARSGNVKLTGCKFAGGIHLKAHSGNLFMADCTGDVETDCRSGNISIFGHHGSCSANTVSGNLKVVTDALTGEPKLSAKSGNIYLEAGRLSGALNLSGISGNIKFKIFKFCEEASIYGSVKSGNITGYLGSDTKAYFNLQSSPIRNDFASNEVPPTDQPSVILRSQNGLVRVKRIE
jgi:DUF4097 and DUF4098 domain-containing protein YvlB